jgi:hypothetical protein
VHVLAASDYRVDRARLDALGATDAVRFDDQRYLERFVVATTPFVRLGGYGEQARQGTRTSVTARRTAIDVRFA